MTSFALLTEKLSLGCLGVVNSFLNKHYNGVDTHNRIRTHAPLAHQKRIITRLIPLTINCFAIVSGETQGENEQKKRDRKVKTPQPHSRRPPQAIKSERTKGKWLRVGSIPSFHFHYLPRPLSLGVARPRGPWYVVSPVALVAVVTLVRSCFDDFFACDYVMRGKGFLEVKNEGLGLTVKGLS